MRGEVADHLRDHRRFPLRLLLDKTVRLENAAQVEADRRSRKHAVRAAAVHLHDALEQRYRENQVVAPKRDAVAVRPDAAQRRLQLARRAVDPRDVVELHPQHHALVRRALVRDDRPVHPPRRDDKQVARA